MPSAHHTYPHHLHRSTKNLKSGQHNVPCFSARRVPVHVPDNDVIQFKSIMFALSLLVHFFAPKYPTTSFITLNMLYIAFKCAFLSFVGEEAVPGKGTSWICSDRRSWQCHRYDKQNLLSWYLMQCAPKSPRWLLCFCSHQVFLSMGHGNCQWNSFKKCIPACVRP